MDPVSIALGGASLLGGVLGGNKNFGSSADLGTGRAYLGDLSGIAGQYGTLASGALGDFSGDNAGYRSAVTDEANYLKTDPLTDSSTTQQVANMTAGTVDHFNAARASLSADLARRGLTDSSQAAGGLSGIASAQAGTIAGAQNRVTQNALSQHAARLQALTSLQGGEANQDYSRGVGALGAESSLYGGLGQDYLNLGSREQGQEQAAQGASNSLIGQGAGILAGASGGY